MNEIATRPTDADMGAFNPDDEQILNYLSLNPRDPKSRAVVAVCQRYNLDPVLKHVIVIPKGGVYITRDGYLHIAHRSGQLDGIVVDEEPHLVDGEWRCKVSVYRKDMRFPFTFPGRYSATGSNRAYAQEMALKVAESHAYRRAFDVGGLPSFDEHQADINEPTAPVSASDFAQSPPAEPVEYPQADPEPADGITSGQQKKMGALMREVGITEREHALAYVNDTIGREVASRSELTKAEAGQVIDALERDGQQEATNPSAPWPTEGGEG